MAEVVHGKRLSELDALRGIAAFAVVLFHFTYGYCIEYLIMQQYYR
jgi:peptidoglycan/LPS O-acetylase OafA/YrhL